MIRVAALAFLVLVASAQEARDRCVILISVDGLAGFYLDDPRADMPTIRRLAREGARAEGLLCSFPTVTWPNHTTLVTGVHPGRHGVIGNDYFDRSQQKVVPLLLDLHFDKDEIVKVPTIYDLAHRAGLKTAAVVWPATRNAKTLDWTMPDMKPNDLFLKYTTPAWAEELRKDGVPIDMQEAWCNKAGGGVPRDWMYARATAQVIKRHKPNVVLLHLVEADHAQHDKGPRSPDAYWSCSHSDDRVRDVIEAVEAAGMKDRTTVIVASDHGFIAYEKLILPNVLLRKAGLVQMQGATLVSRRAFALAQGGGAFVYVLDRERRGEVLEQVKRILGEAEGVAAVVDERGYAALGLATPDKDPRMPDLVLSAKDGYSFANTPTGEAGVVENSPKGVKGSHGYLPAEPQMHGTLVVWGAGIKPGTKLPLVRNVDVAPMMARLLGLKMEKVDGRVLEEILK